MSWLQISIEASPRDADQIEQALLSSGACSVTLNDAGDVPVLEPAPGEAPLWSRVRMMGLYPGDVDRDRIQLDLLTQLGDQALSLRVAELADRNWVAAWRARVEPLRFGERLWVLPGDDAAPAEDATILRLHPGLAFGTGTHPTTALCLEWLDEHPPLGLRVIDYGCGSGILAVAAALLGAKQVLCVDHDPQACTATLANARANGVADKLEIVTPAELKHGGTDLILANILLKPLTDLAPKFADWLCLDGQVVLSGVLKTQQQDLQHAYAEYFGDLAFSDREGWLRASSVRSSADT